MSKLLNSLIKSASEDEKQIVELMLRKALDLVSSSGENKLDLSVSGSDLSLSSSMNAETTTVEQARTIDKEKANLLAFTASGALLRTIVERSDFDFVNNSNGSNALHMATSLDSLFVLLSKVCLFVCLFVSNILKKQLNKADESTIMSRNKEGDTVLSAVCKKASSLKKESRFAEFVCLLLLKCSECVNVEDSMGRKPLSTLALKMSSLSPKASEQQQQQQFDSKQPFERFLFSSSLSDVSFQLDSGVFVPAHKIILVSFSHALRALLEDNAHFAEGEREKKKEIFFAFFNKKFVYVCS